MKNLILLIVVVLTSTLFSCKKKDVAPNTECVQIVEFEMVWQNKANCTNADFVVAYGTAQDQAVTGWNTHSIGSGVRVPAEDAIYFDTIHYYYRPTNVDNNFERFRYRRKQ